MKDTIEGGTVPVSPRESAPADNACVYCDDGSFREINDIFPSR